MMPYWAIFNYGTEFLAALIANQRKQNFRQNDNSKLSKGNLECVVEVNTEANMFYKKNSNKNNIFTISTLKKCTMYIKIQ